MPPSPAPTRTIASRRSSAARTRSRRSSSVATSPSATANDETCRGSLIRDVEDDLAHHGTIVELPDRRGGLGQRIPRVDARTEPTSGDMLPERLPLPGDEGGIAEGRSTPGHALDRDVLQQQPVDLDRGDLAGGETENQQTSEGREHTGGVGEAITSDRIEDI